MKARFVLIAFIIFFLSLISSGQIFAATAQSLSVSNLPSIIDQSQEVEFNITFVCPSCSSDSYLRGVFYPSGTSYFGFTQDNNGSWSNASGGNCTTFFKIAQTDFNKEGTWSGKLKVKPDIASAYYNGPGEYLFKVGRYTPSCSSPSVWSAETTVAITGPTPTPTAVPTETPVPTATPKPVATSTPTPTIKPTNTLFPAVKGITPKISPSISQKTAQTEVLGASNQNLAAKPTISGIQNKKTEALAESSNKLLPILFIFLGIVFVFLCVIVIYYPKIEEFLKSKING